MRIRSLMIGAAVSVISVPFSNEFNRVTANDRATVRGKIVTKNDEWLRGWEHLMLVIVERVHYPLNSIDQSYLCIRTYLGNMCLPKQGNWEFIGLKSRSMLL